MELDNLAEMLQQLEQETEEAERQYETWRVSMGLSDAKPQQETGPQANMQPQKASEAPHAAPSVPSVTAVERRNIQVYGLRRKYCGQKMDPRLDQAPAETLKYWKEKAPAEMRSGQLHLLARTELSKGQVSDKAMQALLHLQRRKDVEDSRRMFLYGYALVQQPASLNRLEQLCVELPQKGRGKTAEQYALYAVFSMARYIINVTEYMQRVADQKYRNRQELLDQAQQNAQQKLDQAQQSLRSI